MTTMNGFGSPLWSVVTVTYNSAAILRHCWYEAAKPFEWIVVDNGSQDDSADVAEELGARVVRLAANVGFSAANNIGARHSSAPYLFFVRTLTRTAVWSRRS
jgi:N-acetylglucosaminyl-diphospho-decaprenol L-rhamnosyltransferase